MSERPLNVRHEPSIFGSREGCWFWCSCGLRSEGYATVSSAGYGWAKHLQRALEEQDA